MSVRRSLAWTFSAQAFGFLVTFGSSVVVARIVSPRDFGIFGMANAATTIINVLMQFGLAKYLMRETDLSRDLLRSVFTVNVLMTFLYCGAILLGSVAAGRLFGSPEVGRFLLVFALFPLFGMMEFVPAALCAREMRFGIVAALTTVRATVLAVATILFAMAGYGYMAFAWAQVLAWLFTSICYNFIVWRPDVWKFRLKGIRDILHFGTQMIGISGLNQLSTRAGEMALGSLLGLTSLGIYNRAASLPTTLYQNVFGVASNVIFSRLSKDLRETGEFHDTYLRFMRLIMGLLWPMMFGLAVLAQPVIYYVYSEKWQAAATPLALLTIASAITVAIGMTSEIFILRHQTKSQVKIESARAAAGFALFATAASIGVVLAAAAKVGEAAIAFLLYRQPMVRLIGGVRRDLGRLYLESLLLTVAATLPAFILMISTHWSPHTSLPLILAAIALGVGLWGLLLFYRRHPIAFEVSRLFRALR